jgi:hypothetical protein
LLVFTDYLAAFVEGLFKVEEPVVPEGFLF